MTKPQDIIDALGRENAAAALDVTPASMRTTLTRGKLPPSWWVVVRDMCQEAGVPCSEEMFGFKARANITSKRGDASGAVQVGCGE